MIDVTCTIGRKTRPQTMSMAVSVHSIWANHAISRNILLHHLYPSADIILSMPASQDSDSERCLVILEHIFRYLELTLLKAVKAANLARSVVLWL